MSKSINLKLNLSSWKVKFQSKTFSLQIEKFFDHSSAYWMVLTGDPRRSWFWLFADSKTANNEEKLSLIAKINLLCAINGVLVFTVWDFSRMQPLQIARETCKFPKFSVQKKEIEQRHLNKYNTVKWEPLTGSHCRQMVVMWSSKMLWKFKMDPQKRKSLYEGGR